MKAIRPNKLPTRSSLFTLLFAVCLALTLVLVPGGQATLARPAAEPRGGAPRAALGTSFTYQGQLKDGGNPANGQYDFVFTLYDALVGGNQVGAAVNLTNQTVTEGLFTVQLDFGASAFQGDARWLEIAVRQTGGGSYTTLSPRQPLTATPYAESLMPGAVITGTVAGPGLSITNTNGIGVQGTSNSGHGVHGYTNGINVAGVFGESSGNGYGVYGRSTSSYAAVLGIGTAADGTGVAGIANSGSTSKGVYGSGGNGSGVFGEATGGIGVNGYSGTGDGVYGRSDSGNGVHGSGDSGVYGEGSTSGVWGNSSSGNGVYGSSSATNGTGVHGLATGTGGNGVYGSGYYGVHGYSSNGYAVYGEADNSAGVYGQSAVGTGVYGQSAAGNGVSAVSNDNYGVQGFTTGTNKAGVFGGGGGSSYGVEGDSGSSYAAVLGYSTNGSGTGVYGLNTSTTGWATAGINNTNSTSARGIVGGSQYGYGVYGSSTSGYAGWFDGNVHTGGFAASLGTYEIDDPLDPANKYLVQAAVQSADPVSVYSGNVTTDAKGDATVTLPSYVEALNTDFRYQLTIMGDQFAQARVSSEVKNNSFSIKTDKPNVKVSWQVTGTRQDAYAKAHPVVSEVAKPQQEAGKYRNPVELGLPASKAINYEMQQRMDSMYSEAQKAKP